MDYRLKGGNMLSFLFFSWLLIFFSSCSEKKQSEVELSYSGSFSKEETYFKYPTNLDISGNHIFINDQPLSTVFTYDDEGYLQNEVGGAGRGPGELNYPLSLSADDNLLIINDQGNSRFQIFDLNGLYQRSFILSDFVQEFVYKDSVIYAFAAKPGLRFKDLDQEDIDLITVYNLDGKKINSFGNHLNFFQELPLDMSNSYLQVYNNKLYVLSKYFPVLQIFNLNDYSLEYIDLNKEDYKDRIKINYSVNTYINIAKMPTKFLFRSFYVDKNGIYIGLYDNKLIIDQYSLTGKFQMRHYFRSADDYYLHDFIKINSMILALERINHTYKINKYKLNE